MQRIDKLKCRRGLSGCDTHLKTHTSTHRCQAKHMLQCCFFTPHHSCPWHILLISWIMRCVSQLERIRSSLLAAHLTLRSPRDSSIWVLEESLDDSALSAVVHGWAVSEVIKKVDQMCFFYPSEGFSDLILLQPLLERSISAAERPGKGPETQVHSGQRSRARNWLRVSLWQGDKCLNE